MIHETLRAKINEELTGFKKNALMMNPSYAPTQWEILDLIDYYWVDKFKDGDRTENGWKKAFYNIVQNPTLVSSKMIDLDTKDIQVKAADGQSYYPAWLFSRELNLYMKEKNWASLLNQIVYNWPKYGSILLKKAGSDIYYTPIKNVSMDTDVENLEDTTFLIERHIYTPYTIRQQGWDEAAVEEAIQKSTGGVSTGTGADPTNQNGLAQGGKNRIIVYERFGACEGEYNNYHIISQEGVLLHSAHYNSISEIYRKLDWDKIPGRMLGRGTVEKLFEAQIQQNRVANYKTEGLHWSSKHIFQTRDMTFNKNLTTDVENGEVLTLLQELMPVATEERNLAAYSSEEQKWDKLTKDLTFSFAEVQGERPPAGTPLGTSVLQTQQATAFFDMKREDLGIFLKGIIYDWVIPEFYRTKMSEHIIMLSEFDQAELNKIRNVFITQRSNQAIVESIIRNKRIPDETEISLIRSITKKEVQSEREMKIPAKYYENLKYKVDVIITNEQVDIAARLSTLQTALGILSTNPGVLENPTTKTIFYKLLDLSGINPVDLGAEDLSNEETSSILQTAPLQRGGSVAAPATPATPVTSQAATPV